MDKMDLIAAGFASVFKGARIFDADIFIENGHRYFSRTISVEFPLAE